MSYTDKWTDNKLEELERHIAGIYRDAYQDLKEKTERYWNGWDEVVDGKTVHHAGFKERYEKEYAAYQNGAYTDAEFAAWCRSQTGRGSRWKGARDEMAARLSNANVLAANYINGETPAVFAENANFEAFKIEQANFSADFRLLDETTVKRLTMGKDDLFPQLSISLAEDQLWNRTKLHTQLLQGIIQGERIGQIANRFQTVANMNRSSAIRNARTAVTGAQNAGRHETYERAEKMGIQMEQEWISTSDERTRESHVMMNGVRVKVNERFPNGLRWPGDSTGAPEEIWNCRCTLRSILPKYNGAARTENTVASYNEWKEQKGIQTYWWQEEAPEVAPVKEEQIVNKYGKEIEFDEKIAEEPRAIIEKLAKEYDTRVQYVRVGSERSAGSVHTGGATMHLSARKKEVPIHEFAHTLASSYDDKIGLTHDQDFWKEIKKIQREYRKNAGDDTSKWISTYEHGSNNVNEFFAEAFTVAKMNEYGIDIPRQYGKDLTYPNKVLSVVDRYFRKNGKL